MPIGPLKNLSIFNKTSGTPQAGRAQSFSPTNLGRESVKGAKISMNQAMSGSTKKTTSISHPEGYSKGATTSVSRPVEIEESLSRENMSDQERDERRYNYIRRMVKARQAKEERQAIKAEENKERDQSDIKLRTGSGFRSKGKLGVVKQMAKLKRTKPSSYKNISKQDSEYFAGVLKPHAKAVGRSKGFDRSARTSMKQKLERDKKAGVISSKDSKDFKKMIDQLPH